MLMMPSHFPPFPHLFFPIFLAETPHNAPFISGIRPRYRVGDILRGNCTSRHSRPAANLTWTVNNEEVSTAPCLGIQPPHSPKPPLKQHHWMRPKLCKHNFLVFKRWHLSGIYASAFWKGLRAPPVITRKTHAFAEINAWRHAPLHSPTLLYPPIFRQRQILGVIFCSN